MSEKRVRVLRLLEYYGTPEAIAKTFAGNAVKRIHSIPDIEIRESIIGEMPIPLPVDTTDDVESEG